MGRDIHSSVTSEAHPVRNSTSGLIGSLRNGGERLPGPSRAFFESRLHYDFGQVRTHTGPRAEEAARSVNARAFTIGRDVFFGAGQFAPETKEGQRLLAHELTHVVQQTSSSSHRASTIQRQVASTAPAAGPTPARDKEATTAGMIVEDTATDLQPGQMMKTKFLTELQRRSAVLLRQFSPLRGARLKIVPISIFGSVFTARKTVGISNALFISMRQRHQRPLRPGITSR